MRSDSSTVHDNIPIKFLKFAADDIFLPLANITLKQLSAFIKIKKMMIYKNTQSGSF